MLTISSAGWSTRWVGQCTPTRPCVEKAWCQVAAREDFVEEEASFQEARLITWWNVTLSQACSILFIVLVCLQLHGCPYPDAVWAPGEAWLDCGCWPRLGHNLFWIPPQYDSTGDDKTGCVQQVSKYMFRVRACVWGAKVGRLEWFVNLCASIYALKHKPVVGVGTQVGMARNCKNQL